MSFTLVREQISFEPMFCPTWLERIHQRDMPEIQGVSNTKLTTSGTFTLYPRIGESCTRVTFNPVDKLAIPLLRKTIVIDKVVYSIHRAELKIIRYQSQSVPTLMLHEAKSAVEKEKSENRRKFEEYEALFVITSPEDPKNMKVARQVALKAICETLLLVFTTAAGLIKVFPSANVALNRSFMTSKGIMVVYPGHLLTSPPLTSVRLLCTSHRIGKLVKQRMHQTR